MYRADFGRQTRIILMRCDSYINACRSMCYYLLLVCTYHYTPPLVNVTLSKVVGCRSHCHILSSDNDETTRPYTPFSTLDTPLTSKGIL